MNRRLLIVVAALVGVGIALFFLLGGGGGSKKAAPAQPSADSTDRDEPPDRIAARERQRPATPAGIDPSTGEEAGEYMLEDGTTVRDHRSGGSAPYIRPSLPHRADSPVTPTVTSNVMRAVRPIVLKCMADVPPEAFGKSPLVETRASISIDDQGNLTVLELGPALADIDEASAAAALDCIRAGAASIHVHVDHGAVPQATLAFAIRPLDYRRNAN